jgi:hypothetical protein
MIKALFWIVVGVVVALQGERMLAGLRSRLSPNAVTGAFLDRVNRKLEDSRTGAART